MTNKRGDSPVEEVCTTQRAAEILGISVSSVQQLVEAGVITAWKTKGGHRRIPLAAVLRYKADGSLDQEFATSDDGTPNGIANISLGDGNDVASGVSLQGDKLIVVGGTTVAKDGSKNIAVLRLIAH